MTQSHPHQAFLDQFQIAIDKLVPLLPEEIRVEAEELHKELAENHGASQRQILQALSLIGRKEFPYRKAYHEICAGDEEQRLVEATFERLDEKLRERVGELTQHGVLLDDFIGSRLFEDQFTPEERQEISQAVLLAEEVVDSQCDERAHRRQKQYDELVARWHDEAKRLQGLIDELRNVAQMHPDHQAEIDAVIERLEEGWSIIERDPQEEEIAKELAYWREFTANNEELE